MNALTTCGPTAPPPSSLSPVTPPVFPTVADDDVADPGSLPAEGLAILAAPPVFLSPNFTLAPPLAPAALLPRAALRRIEENMPAAVVASVVAVLTPVPAASPEDDHGIAVFFAGFDDDEGGGGGGGGGDFLACAMVRKRRSRRPSLFIESKDTKTRYDAGGERRVRHLQRGGESGFLLPGAGKNKIVRDRNLETKKCMTWTDGSCMIGTLLIP